MFNDVDHHHHHHHHHLYSHQKQLNWSDTPGGPRLLSRKRQEILGILPEIRIFRPFLWVVNKIWCQCDQIQCLKHVNFAWPSQILEEWRGERQIGPAYDRGLGCTKKKSIKRDSKYKMWTSPNSPSACVGRSITEIHSRETIVETFICAPQQIDVFSSQVVWKVSRWDWKDV